MSTFFVDPNTLLSYVVTGNLAMLKTYKLNNDIKDRYNNTLLHLAVKSKQYDVLDYLMMIGIDTTKKNMFNETAYNIAVQQQDYIAISKFNNTRELDALKLENEKVKTVQSDNTTLKLLNNSLQTSNDRLSHKIIGLTDDNKDLKNKNSCMTSEKLMLNRENSNLKEEIGVVTRSAKRLRDEVCTLTEQNKKLKTSVDTLLDSKKKI